MLSIEEFLSYLQHQRRLSGHTVTAYRTDLGEFLKYCREEQRVDDPGLADRVTVKAWMIHLAEAGRSARTIRRKLSALKSFYRWRQQKGLQETNPTARVPVPKLGKALPTTFAAQPLQQLFAGFPDPLVDDDFCSLRDHVILAVLYQTGIRRAELIQLPVAAVDLAGAKLSVTGKGGKQRYVPFGPALGELLARYGEVRERTFPAAPENLLLTDKGKAMYPKFVYNKVVRYLGTVTTQAAKHPHVLRHTFATQLLNGGADLNAVKELLGHANLAATQVYTHSDAARLREVYRKAHPEGESLARN